MVFDESTYDHCHRRRDCCIVIRLWRHTRVVLMPVVSTRISPEMLSTITHLAQARGQKKAGVMLEALQTYTREAALGKAPVWLEFETGPPSVNLSGTYTSDQLRTILQALMSINDKAE